MTHFLDKFNSDTDVLYGMGKWIHYYIYNYYFVWKGYLDPAEVPAYTPEDMPKDKWNKAHEAYQKNVINRYNEPMQTASFTVGQDQMTTVTPENPPDDPILTHYFRSLQLSTGFGPDSVEGPIEKLEEALRDYEGGPDYLKRNMNSRTRKSIAFMAYDIAIRRSCKFGVDYFSTMGTVHYILDELDIEKVATHEMVVNDTTRKGKVPICTTELWYIFRRWADLKNGPKVRFWCDFEEVPPPWEWERWSHVRAHWARFAVERFRAYQHRIPRPVQSLFAHALQQYETAPASAATALTVIRSFHRLPTAYLNYPLETGALPESEPEGGWHLVAAPRDPSARGVPGLDA